MPDEVLETAEVISCQKTENSVLIAPQFLERLVKEAIEERRRLLGALQKQNEILERLDAERLKI